MQIRAAAGAAFLVVLAGFACDVRRQRPAAPVQTGATVPQRPIEDVVRDRAPELMKLPSVVGVYQGARDDGSPVIRVMLAKDDPSTTKAVPKTLEGWPVEVEVTGPIRPLSEPSP